MSIQEEQDFLHSVGCYDISIIRKPEPVLILICLDKRKAQELYYYLVGNAHKLGFAIAENGTYVVRITFKSGIRTSIPTDKKESSYPAILLLKNAGIRKITSGVWQNQGQVDAFQPPLPIENDTSLN